MKYKMLLLIPLSLLVGCTTAPSDPGEKYDKLNVPAVKGYTPEQQEQAAVEREKFCHLVPMLCKMVDDFGVMRDQARAALGIEVDVRR